MIRLSGPAETEAFGASLARILRTGDAIALFGDLGAGKTTLTRGLLRGLGFEGDVASPTFPIVQIYEPPALRIAVWHVDLYRIGNPAELDELGLDDARDQAAAVIEWPERLGTDLPPDRLEVALEIGAATGADVADAPRLARFSGHGAWIGRVDDLLRSPFA